MRKITPKENISRLSRHRALPNLPSGSWYFRNEEYHHDHSQAPVDGRLPSRNLSRRFPRISGKDGLECLCAGIRNESHAGFGDIAFAGGATLESQGGQAAGGLGRWRVGRGERINPFSFF
jgi:hypothetical protein